MLLICNHPLHLLPSPWLALSVFPFRSFAFFRLEQLILFYLFCDDETESKGLSGLYSCIQIWIGPNTDFFFLSKQNIHFLV